MGFNSVGWLAVVDRLPAMGCLRPSYATGVWATGFDRMSRHVMLGNILRQLGVDVGVKYRGVFV